MTVVIRVMSQDFVRVSTTQKIVQTIFELVKYSEFEFVLKNQIKNKISGRIVGPIDTNEKYFRCL
jgi:hypothetical protein